MSVTHFGRRWQRRCVAAGASNGATGVGRQSSNGAGRIAAPKSTVIVGGGPTGLAMATMLAQRGWKNIEVWERRQPPPPPDELSAWGDVERSYNLGISARGQNVLRQLGALELVLRWCAGVTGRHDWSPGGPEEGVVRDTSYRDYTVQVMPRDRLASCLLQHVRQHHSDAVRIQFGAVCTSVRWEPDGVLLTRRDAGEAPVQQVRCDFLVGADGSGSAVMQAMASEPSSSTGNEDGEFRIRRLPGRITRLYRTLRLEVPPGWRGDTNYAARTEQGHVLEMLPTREGILFGALLFREDDPIVPAISTEAQARDYFKRNFPQMYPHIADDEFAAFARRSLSRLPNFQYCGPRLHRGGNTVVLGDCIHTVKPYYGLGVNSALEDVAMLSECLQQHGETDLPSALRSFSSRRAKDAEALVQMSHAYDGEFFRRVLPFLLDTALHSAFPSLLRPATMRAMQSTDYGTFHQVRERKRAERVVVFSLLLAVPTFAASLAQALAALAQ